MTPRPILACFLSILGVFPSGCSLFRGRPDIAAQKAQDRVSMAQLGVAAKGHEFTFMAAEVLAQDPAPTIPARLASGLLADAMAALDSGLGSIPIVRQQSLDSTVQKLLSDQAKEVEKGRKELATLRSSSADQDTELQRLKDEAKAKDAQLRVAYAERDEKARKWERMWFWIKLLAGGWLFIAFVLPILGKAFPAIGAFSTVAQAVVAPFAAIGKRTAEKAVVQVSKVAAEAGSVRDDLIGAIEELRTKAKAQGNVPKAEADAILKDWVTEADGTAALVDERRRALKLI